MDRSPLNNGLSGPMVERSATNNRSERGQRRRLLLSQIDLAKNVFQLHGCDANGMAMFVPNLPRCVVTEACATAHYWGVGDRAKANKNDASESMHFVTVKNAAQQNEQAGASSAAMAVKTRTALVNQARGLLAEHGIVIAQGVATCVGFCL